MMTSAISPIWDRPSREGNSCSRGFSARSSRRRPPRRPGHGTARSLGRLDGDGGDADRTLVAPAAAGGCGRVPRRGNRSRGAAPPVARPRADAPGDGLAGAAAAARERCLPTGATGGRPRCPRQRHHRPAARLSRGASGARGAGSGVSPHPPPLWRVTDAIPLMRRLLAVAPDGEPLPAFLPSIDGGDPGRALRCSAAVASTLVAGLELARDSAVVLDQDAVWTEIRISGRAARPTSRKKPFRSGRECRPGRRRDSSWLLKSS